MAETPPPLADVLRDLYDIERELGRGGMATVYLARDLKHDRLVAAGVYRWDHQPTDHLLRPSVQDPTS